VDGSWLATGELEARELMTLTTKSALEQARLIREREVSATDLLDAHFEQIHARNEELQAFV
jgi:Asp-tRNA(Asn)/Glu-tRNA(Gln) amidotransferase A subunit family amidase